MNWYYATGKEKKGPVDGAALKVLVDSGQLTGESLVWREGMASWQSYSSVAAEITGVGSDGEELIQCAYSGEMRAKSGMLSYGDKWVAAEHKEAFVQALQQGKDVSGEDTVTSMFYVGFWWRVLASVIDWAVKLVPNIIFSIPYYIWYFGFLQEQMSGGAAPDPAALANEIGPEMAWRYGVMILGMVGFSMAYETWMVGKYGGTVGKLALSFRIVNVDGTKVSYLKSFARWWAEALVKLITFVVGYVPFIIVMVSYGMFTLTPGAQPPDEAIVPVMIAMFSMLVLLPLGAFGYWMAGVTKEKKALHDVICKTRVVRKA